MEKGWLEWLIRQGAVVENGRVVSFGDAPSETRAAHEGDTAADLSHIGFVRLAGKDAEGFLQRLTTNDVSLIHSARSGLGALCNPKGRVVAVFRLFRRGEEFWLATPHSMVPTLFDLLVRNRFRSSVEIRDGSGEWRRVGFSGPGIPDSLRKMGLPIPEEEDGVTNQETFTILRIPGPAPRFVILGAENHLQELWDALPVRKVGAPPWTLLSIEVGLPDIYPATSQAFLPQWLDLQRWGGLSFSKGCFPGQEIVARTQHLGTITRRLIRGKTMGPVPVPGTRLWDIHPEGCKDGGTLVESATGGEGSVRLLAVVPEAVVGGLRPLRCGTEDGPMIHLEMESVEKP